MLSLSLAAALMVPAADAAPDARKAVERGLVFLRKDALHWKQERQCATCHHGALTVWAFAEARSQGYTVPDDSFAEILKWTKDKHLKTIDQPRDKRLGWNMVNSAALYLAMTATLVPRQQVISEDELKRIAGSLIRHQESDGSWVWSSAPAKNRPPPFFESDEVATRLASMALGSQVPPDSKEPSTARDSRVKAAEWLAKQTLQDTTQAAAVRLLMKIRSGARAPELDADVRQLLARQNKDGGWGQLKDLPSDAYATGQTLYILSIAGLTKERKEVANAVSFLVANQREDGSWPMKPRAHPTATPAKNIEPITHFGSAWAVIALARLIPAD
jgi:hypothetical protein